jgi:hypothetical protein
MPPFHLFFPFPRAQSERPLEITVDFKKPSIFIDTASNEDKTEAA